MPTGCSTIRRGDRSDRVLPQPGDGGTGAADAPLRHPRLRDVGPHRLRIGRPGDRHRAEADPPRQRRLRACRRLRFDDQPGRPGAASACCRRYRPTTTRRSARAARSTRRATASCSAKAPAFSCSRNGKRRAGAARTSTPSLPATAIRCRRYRITDSPPDGDGPIQSMRAALADAGAAPEDVDYINAHGTSTYMNDKQRKRRDPRGVRRQGRRRRGQLDQELDGPSDRRGRRGRGRGVRAGDPTRRAADQREPARARPRLRPESASSRRRRRRVRMTLVQLVRIRRLEQLRRAAPSGRSGPDARVGASMPRPQNSDHRHRRGLRVRHGPWRDPGGGARRTFGDRADRAMGHDRLAGARRRRNAGLQSARAGRGPQAAQADPPHRHVRPVRGGARRSTRPAFMSARDGAR